MTEVTFFRQEEIPDGLLKFAVIAARFEGRWVFCRHKRRSTWEIPGGHREPGETVSETARRELWEETGALETELRPVCVYGVTRDGSTSYGMLFFGEIAALEELPRDSEIGQIVLMDTLPEELTYPEIQPHLYEKVRDLLTAVVS